MLTVLLEYIDLFNLNGNIKQTSITLTEGTPFNAMLHFHQAPVQQITILAHVKIANNTAVTRRSRRTQCAFFTYYAGIMLECTVVSFLDL